MNEIALIFPDQLFLDHPCLAPGRTVYLVEEFLFFRVQFFHKQRLVLLRAAMQKYAERLIKHHYQVVYIESKDLAKRGDLFERLAEKKVKRLHMAEFADDWLLQDVKEAASEHGWSLSFYPSPGFLCSNEELNAFFEGKEHFSMAQFYAYERKCRHILMDGARPIGGKFSFDTENRKKIPKNLSIPQTYIPPSNKGLKQIADEVEREFPQAVGDGFPFLYPTTHEEAKVALDRFLEDKLELFGDYQDAIDKEDSFLFHSVLSPLLNIGLLTPQQVVQAAINHAECSKTPLNCLEGFIRQIMCWREFVRASYLLKGRQQRSSNFFEHKEKIPKKFWEGETGIYPIDCTIQKVLKTGYCNHIERLMVLGNFFLLTETSPEDVYRWFMGFFVDAYDWVMVSNVFGMSQFADGGGIVTKPYISSSNYLLKMSNYPKGEWTEIWDGLFWRFIKKHHAFFSSNIRMQNLVKLLEKNKASIDPKILEAEAWLIHYRNDHT